MDKEVNENIGFKNLVISFLNGSASSKDIDKLKDWVTQSKENLDEFYKMRIAWIASSQVLQNRKINIEGALSQVNQKISLRDRKVSGDSVFAIRGFVKIAATLLLMVILGGLGSLVYMKYGSSSNASGSFIFVYAPKGSKAITILPDGTKVWLNAGSNLMYDPNAFLRKNRHVALIGEGYFKVLPNAAKPFSVSTKNLEIVALGTEFNVKAYPEEDEIETTLVNGKVKINGINQHKQLFSVTLKPSQQFTLLSGKSFIHDTLLTDPAKIEAKHLTEIQLEEVHSKKPVEPLITDLETTELITSWTQDNWIFKGIDLGSLAVQLERRYDTKIVFESEELKKYTFSGKFQNETIEQIMQVLKLTTPLQYEIGKGEIVLTLDTKMKKKYEKYMY
jgi:ferric-dicitrate binding protein FerR (iron transport regulator)